MKRLISFIMFLGLIVLSSILFACSHAVKTAPPKEDTQKASCQEIYNKVFDAQSAQRQIYNQKVIGASSPEYSSSFKFYADKEKHLRVLAANSGCNNLPKESTLEEIDAERQAAEFLARIKVLQSEKAKQEALEEQKRIKQEELRKKEKEQNRIKGEEIKKVALQQQEKEKEQKAQEEQKRIKEEAAKIEALNSLKGKVKFEFVNWTRTGFGSMLAIDFKIYNAKDHQIKDFEITCTSSGNSGTVIDENKVVLYEVVEPMAERSFQAFNMGFLHAQATKIGCVVTSFNE